MNATGIGARCTALSDASELTKSRQSLVRNTGRSRLTMTFFGSMEIFPFADQLRTILM